MSTNNPTERAFAALCDMGLVEMLGPADEAEFDFAVPAATETESAMMTHVAFAVLPENENENENGPYELRCYGVRTHHVKLEGGEGEGDLRLTTGPFGVRVHLCEKAAAAKTQS